jgi:glycogen(starch) synthase
MKILLTTDTVGGVWTYAIELARALAPHGVEVALATMGAPVRPEQRRQAEALENVRLFESDFKLEWMPEPWNDVRRCGDWLLELEAQTRPDVVHLNGYAHAALPWSAPTVVVGHSCVLSWWQAVKGEPAPPDWDRYAEAVRRGLRAADAVVAPSAAMIY